jgi:hypothetical protein
MAVGMSHQLIRFFTRRIKTQWMIHVVVNREWHRGICAIYAGATCVYQVLYFLVAATLQDMRKSNDVAIDVGKRVINRVANTSLSGKINYSLRLSDLEAMPNGIAIR